MRRFIPFLAILIVFLSSCDKGVNNVLNEEQRISFLSNYKVQVDISRPYYNSNSTVPKIFTTVWKVREILSKDMPGVDISKFKGQQCSIYMYPISKLPFTVKKDSSIEARAVIISCQGSIICSYIEFISELRSLPPMTMGGKSVADLSGVPWDTWKEQLDGDDDKSIVIYQYYNALRSGDVDEAYSYIYDKNTINKEDFTKTVKQNSLPYINFLSVDQYKEPTQDECFYIVEANVSNSKQKKTYNIMFDLKKDPAAKDYGGWKIYKTQIK